MNSNADNVSVNVQEQDLSEIDVLRLENLSLLKRWLQSEADRIALLERHLHLDLANRYGIAGDCSVNLNKRKLIARIRGHHDESSHR